jgi:hypothetical protein
VKIALIEEVTHSGKTIHYPVTDENGKSLPFERAADAIRYIEAHYNSNCSFYMLKHHLVLDELFENG